MNKARKSHRSLSFAEITLLILAAIVLMTAGVTHAWLKNSQVEVVREVDKTQRRISDHGDSINSLQVKIDKKLNIYQLRDDLERGQSELVVVPVSAIEKIQPYTRPRSPDLPTAVAQRRP
ncbi:hypothetical protein JIN77_01190 [Verrucomicrobiaceae bacterium R5-34]|uniref:Uncharacterized protein n=1 Tax=Oceaniferula flava TaxID=2800421 RepID=A0AAE2S9I5_9BACT|nr:hypothetical protein [Oceaniferula flavus]MBK1829326.1 hypothetical protein [Verrucomicrobiaceae bacterium R5-34]MBK1853553.1 hypothetical protein [Oceaniferula flavus]MBM1134858.1 hypothetical protein [Oceaniferula flavus]